uniref:DUF945 domain-containing protein n=1 Tax=Geladintestivirus 1 TaxID=3233133 RepID=A0AAU8MHJ4_9CAUD
MAKYELKGKPWLIPGARNVSDCKTSKEVMDKAGLDFTVDKCELVAKMPVNMNNTDRMLDDMNDNLAFAHNGNIYRDCPNAFATFRTDENIPLGIVKSRYEIVQNRDAFNFFDAAIGENEAIWQTAGFFGDGERIFVTAKLPDFIKVKKDLIENYLVFANSHDGSSGVNILFTPIRVVCQNTLNAAIRKADCFVRFRHTANVHDNIKRAHEVLGIVKTQMEDISDTFNFLADKPMTDNQVKDFIAKTYLDNGKYIAITEYDKKYGLDKIFRLDTNAMEATGIKTRGANILKKTYEYYHEGFGQKEFEGTAYGAYNAITGYYANIDNSTGEDKMKSVLYGRTMDITSQALQNAINY